MSGSDNQCTSKYSIFEQTQVSLNREFLSLIPNSVDQASFFIDIAEELQLTFCEQIDNGCLVFLGNWNNILKAEKLLQDCLRLWVEERGLNDSNSKDEQMTAEDPGEISVLIPEGYVPAVLPGGSQLYFVSNDSQKGERAQLLPCKLAPDKRKQKLPTTQENSPVNEIHVDIAVNSVKEIKSSQEFDLKAPSDEDQNPLDRLCHLLCIEEDETIEKSISLSEKRRSYEENLPYKYFCDKCSFKAKRENHLVKHLKLHDKKKVVFCCEQCDFRTICERSLSRHKVTHSNTKLTCKLCPFETDTRTSLQKHNQTKHGSNYAKTVKCRHCDFVATKPREMIHHLKLLHPKSEFTRTWKCSKCPYKSKLRAHLNRHMNDVHDCVRKFLCQYCGKNFKRSDTLTAHKATHGELSRTYTCQHCGKTFLKPVHLQQHLTKHSSERPFLCDMCGKSYKTLQATRRHKRFMHSDNIRMWSCPKNCERTFKYRTHLNKHLKQPCRKPHRSKAETTHVPDVISGAILQEDVVPTPITIQVVYTEHVESTNQNEVEQDPVIPIYET